MISRRGHQRKKSSYHFSIFGVFYYVSIQVTISGTQVTVDEEFAYLLNDERWEVRPTGYVTQHRAIHFIYLHHQIKPLKYRLFLHHADGDKSNNTQRNLHYWTERKCQFKVDQLNGNGFFGVRPAERGYEVTYSVMGKRVSNGIYPLAIDAALCFDRMMDEIFPGMGPRNYQHFQREFYDHFHPKYASRIEQEVLYNVYRAIIKNNVYESMETLQPLGKLKSPISGHENKIGGV